MNWYDDDDFWATFGDVLFTRQRREEAPKEVDRLIDLTDMAPGSSVLDLCCGVGRHALDLARRGFSVTGVDRTEAYLAEAEKTAAEEGLEVELLQADMRRFVRPASFDLALNLFTSFSYFADPQDDLLVLRNLHESLRPGGTLVMEMIGKEILARIFRERDWQELEPGVYMLEERNLAHDWSWMQARWIILQEGTTTKEFTVEHRIYSGRELAVLLERAGFERVTIYGNLTGAPYNHEADRLVAVARK